MIPDLAGKIFYKMKLKRDSYFNHPATDLA